MLNTSPFALTLDPHPTHTLDSHTCKPTIAASSTPHYLFLLGETLLAHINLFLIYILKPGLILSCEHPGGDICFDINVPFSLLKIVIKVSQ